MEPKFNDGPSPERNAPAETTYSLFQMQVIERLTRMETNLTSYHEVKDQADDALNLSRENARQLADMKDERKWGSRAIAVLIITAIVNFTVNAIQGF